MLSFIACLGEFAVAGGEDLLFPSCEFVGGGDVADGAVEPDGVVVFDVVVDDPASVVEAERGLRSDAFGLECFVIAFEF